MPSLFARLFRNGIEPVNSKKEAVKENTNKVSTASSLLLAKKNETVNQTIETPKSNEAPPCAKIRIPLSGGKIETFISCPLKFKYSYIRKVNSDFSSSSSLALDNLIHKSLSSFYRICKRDKVFNKEALYKSLDLNFIPSAFNSKEEASEFKSQAQLMLEQYYESHSNINSTILEIDYFFKVQILNNDYSGKIDRVDLLPNGKIELIDYKSGKIPVGGEKSLISSFSTKMLFVAANKIWPNKVKSIKYIYLKENTDIVVNIEQTETKEALNKFIQCCNSIAKDEFVGIKGYLCSWCSYLKICPEWPNKPNEEVNEPIEEYRKRFRLSYSKMSSYLNCPRAYKFTYVDKIPSSPQPYFDFGTTIHEVFEEVYAPNRTTKPNLEELLKTYEKIRPKYREGFSDPVIEEQYHQDGIRMLTAYYKNYIKDKDFSPAALTEAYFEFPCGKHAIMGGFIDRIDKHTDGTYEILDYKTEPTQRSQADADKDMQLTVYYIAGTKVFGLNIQKLSLLMLEHNEKLETQRSIDDSARVIAYIDEIAQKIINEQEYLPKKNKYCKSCEHLKDCPIKDEILNDTSLSSMQKFAVDFAPEPL